VEKKHGKGFFCVAMDHTKAADPQCRDVKPPQKLDLRFVRNIGKGGGERLLFRGRIERGF
jgi:hypothetical protein